MKKILIFVTNHGTLGNTDEKNGTYAPELTHALHEFLTADFEYEIASIHGGPAPLYGESIDDEVNQRLLKDEAFQKKINNTLSVGDINSEDFQGVFYPGGFGLLSDLAENPEVAQHTAAAYEAGKVIGAVCHGPAGLLPVKLSNGEKLLKGKHVTAFTREEEVDFETISKIPFLLEEVLTRSAGTYSKKGPWVENVLTDGQLITGQNPQSAHGVGKAMVQFLQSKA